MTKSVALKDLKALWLSPVPYIVGALFHVVLGVVAVQELESRRQAVLQPVFPVAGFLLLAVVPVICMRAVADEARSGSLDLLLAIPVGRWPLVVGKWLAAWLTSVLVVLPAATFVAIVAWFGNPDLGPAVAGFIGIVLYSGALSGIGLLASAATHSQPVAAVMAFFVGLLLWFAGAGSQSPHVGAVLDHLSLSQRLRTFAAGAIDSGDVVFFLAIALGAVAVAVVVLDSRRLR